MKKQHKTKEEKKKINWVAWGLLLLVILVLINSNDNEEYQNCVDECVYYNFDCVYDNFIYIKPYTNEAVYYILGDDAVGCVDDLEICINECKR